MNIVTVITECISFKQFKWISRFELYVLFYKNDIWPAVKTHFCTHTRGDSIPLKILLLLNVL